MDAVWGVIDFSSSINSQVIAKKMVESMAGYDLVDIDSEILNNSVIAIGHQYILGESRAFANPKKIDNDFIYAGNCMLDNREELLELLDCESDVSDVEMLFKSYTTWNNDFVNNVLGVFTLVVYDIKNNECKIYNDHLGNRSLYYFFEHNSFMFSTLINPIKSTNRLKIDEKWVTASMSSTSPNMSIYEGLTPYENVFQLPAGTYLTVNSQGVRITPYWDPTKISIDKNIKIDEIKDISLKTLNVCIESLVSRDVNVGMTLSSGLDSGLIACIAAPILDGAQKHLYTYTSVPSSGYEWNKDQYFVDDEREGVAKIVDHFSNILPKFIDYDEINAFDILDEMVTKLEYPYKAVQNIVWLNEIYKQAKKDSVRIVMQGQFGNSTVSYGNILTRVYDELIHLRIDKALKEINSFCVLNGVSRKKALHIFVSEWMSRHKSSKKIELSDIVRKDLTDKYMISKELLKSERQVGGHYIDDRYQRLKFMFYQQELAQLSVFDTRFELMYGVIIRDPLKDKRVIELCAKLPLEAFITQGIERALVRVFAKDVFPDNFDFNIKKRGRQSADFTYRIKRDWDRIKDELVSAMNNDQILDYIDVNRINHLLTMIRKKPEKLGTTEVTEILIICSLSTFLAKS